MKRIKLLLLALFVASLASVAKADSVAGGSFGLLRRSSGVIVNGGGTFMGLECSTPSQTSGLGTIYVQVFDTDTVSGIGAPNVPYSAYIVTAAVTAPLVLSSATQNASGGGWAAEVNKIDYGNVGGRYFSQGLYLYLSAAQPGWGGCVGIYKK